MFLFKDLWRARAETSRYWAALRNVLFVASAIASSAPLVARSATIEDSTKRSVDIPAEVKVVIPAGAPAQVLLHALAPDRLGALVEPFKPEHVIYVDPKVAHLPQIPVLTRMTKPGDIGMVAELKPGLVVDYGNASRRYVAADKRIQKTLGVPTVLFGGSLLDAAKVARTIGGAIGAGAHANDIAAKVDEVLDRAKPLSDLADSGRTAVYLARGADGLLAARAGTSFDEPIRLAGGRNVVEAGNGTFKHMTVEDVVALKPVVVIFATRDALKSPLHAALPRGTKYLLDSGEPYKVLTGPPSINRLVGLAALAVILHSDKFRMEPEEVGRIETALFPIPSGLAVPAPLQAQP